MANSADADHAIRQHVVGLYAGINNYELRNVALAEFNASVAADVTYAIRSRKTLNPVKT